ncbi:MAG TPA: DUF3999 domain-containing protein [Steroidobacteraceae bacterium]|nr:DUF3999 domain-containing protein [Steroidobacteraceae bacterium]
MNRLGPVAAVLLLMPALSFAALTPQDFAFGSEVATPGESSAYRVPLPLAVYQGCVAEDLGDIRVFNASGELVPYALARPSAEQTVHRQSVALALFPLHGDVRAATDALRVTIDSPAGAVRLHAEGVVPTHAGVTQYILDGRAVKMPVTALQLHWPDDSKEFSGRVRVEASDDLGAWRPIAESAPLANLHHDGQELVQNRVEFRPTEAKYWRLSWPSGGASFDLVAVMAEPADDRVDRERATLVVDGRAVPNHRDDTEFDLGGRLPVERVDLQLADVNSVVSAELMTRARLQDPWRPAGRGAFYRLKTADGDLHNEPLRIVVARERYWLVRVLAPSGEAATAPMRLSVTWIPDEIEFLARGAGPFLIAYGNASTRADEADFGSIPLADRALPAVLAKQQVLGGQARLAVPPAPFPMQRALLWAALILAATILAWMAYRLSKEAGAGSPRA